MALIRYTFVGTLRAEGALHIGSGGGGRVAEDDALTDATVIRDSRGRAFVPGSSLRGVLRAAIGQLAPTLPGLETQGVIRDDAEIENAVKELNIDADASEQVLQQQLEGVLTSAERLFGTVHWASPLLIPDLPLSKDDADGDGEIRHGVGIDRDTGAAREGIKYDFEVLRRETEFRLWMRCDVPETPEKHRKIWPILLALALRLLEQGELTLGGRAARGVGQVRLSGLKVYRLELGGRNLLDALLAPPNGAERYGTEQPDWVTKQLRALREGAA